ncbi:hypothetical protein CMK22_14635 [Candidatus Poribacteria bacterium]|nr:hypothetical protein [Candidatus Poribacteria bacterium]
MYTLSLKKQLYDSQLLIEELTNSKALLQNSIQKLATNVESLEKKITELEKRKNQKIKDNEVFEEQFKV